ncbi:hypothetical protein CTEN210_17177 [Chaetoceros tenuissimus]|uniref:Helicase-associated domain-containing protein n=1 Tax=Chaetoceros tenuissimus TaxID=426638 RepID=A0AAD3DA64_9STRA|nr:hypothetical protein CTEN210_17177 [Chaetoceros tenuissimus]
MSSFHNEPDSTNDFVNSILQSNGNDRNDLDIKFDSPTPTTVAQSHSNSLQMEQKLDVIQQLLTSTVMSMRQLSAQIYSCDSKLSAVLRLQEQDRKMLEVNVTNVASIQQTIETMTAIPTTASSDSFKAISAANQSHSTSPDTLQSKSDKVMVVDSSPVADEDVLTRNGSSSTVTTPSESASMDIPILPSISISQSSSSTTIAASEVKKTWNDRYSELKQYKAKNGHTKVPQNENGGLGVWVCQQRSSYKKFKAGKSSSLTNSRVKALDALSFDWSLRKRFTWDERYSQLKKFSEENGGSCNVPFDGQMKGLFGWCENQRRAMNTGKGLSVEKVEKLNAIDFPWVTSNSPWATSNSPSPSVTDESSFGKLEKFGNEIDI